MNERYPVFVYGTNLTVVVVGQQLEVSAVIPAGADAAYAALPHALKPH